MRVVNFSDARNNLKKVIDDVVNDSDFTVISRRDAPDAVLLSLDSFNSLMETVHLLKSPANAAHLARSLAQMESGKTVVRGLMEDEEPPPRKIAGSPSTAGSAKPETKKARATAAKPGKAAR
ncbi:type II toxin-antitoxin system prevent-host-death family antitoxin [Pseudomonas taiwanensis]|uniref:type II toxin-antitoxin system Phd/YefM family antitoxin n=1 Tax=Pseudomonas taiwanensis TaxID=470150 RepID=UPI0015C1166B|nr:type II toxin-antitoxin system prevent-host-death family antitoxin [Pseudomonas taiwanensis]